MPINKLLSILDASEPIKENFEYTKLKPFKNTKKSRWRRNTWRFAFHIWFRERSLGYFL